jgi:predicted alpha/beta hydrolase
VIKWNAWTHVSKLFILAPAFEGRKEIWDALRGACYAIEQNDVDLAQSSKSNSCVFNFLKYSLSIFSY